MTQLHAELAPEALVDVPIFPLPKTVLMPRTMISLHIFEPRYRQMMEHCIEGSRLLVVAMFDENADPDAHGRPAIHRIAGIGALRRSAKLPDGRYNIVVEGLARVDVDEEHPPTRVFRRTSPRVVEDYVPDDNTGMARAIASVRSLCTRALSASSDEEAEMIDGLSRVAEPSALADLVTAAVIKDPQDRQRVLAEPDVLARLEIVSGALGTLLLTQDAPAGQVGWGISTGEA